MRTASRMRFTVENEDNAFSFFPSVLFSFLRVSLFLVSFFSVVLLYYRSPVPLGFYLLFLSFFLSRFFLSRRFVGL